jgi:hypothetical protein
MKDYEGVTAVIDDDTEEKGLISQAELLTSDLHSLQQSLRASDLKHPALARLRCKLDNQYSNACVSTHDRGNPYSRSCFPAGTKVLLADRTTKVIEQISVGDEVMGFNGSEPVPVRVEALESPLRDHFCILTFDDGSSLELTQEHPLCTKDGWRSISPESTVEENEDLTVGKLEIGDQVLTETGDYRLLVNIAFVQGQVQTYNIKKLSQHDNFYVNGLLAHSKAISESASDVWTLILGLPCDGAHQCAGIEPKQSTL